MDNTIITVPSKRVRRPPQALLQYEDVPDTVAKQFESLKTDSGHSAQTNKAPSKEASPAFGQENELVSQVPLNRAAALRGFQDTATARIKVGVSQVHDPVTVPAPGAWTRRDLSALVTWAPDTVMAQSPTWGPTWGPAGGSGASSSGAHTGLQLLKTVCVTRVPSGVAATPLHQAFAQPSKHLNACQGSPAAVPSIVKGSHPVAGTSGTASNPDSRVDSASTASAGDAPTSSPPTMAGSQGANATSTSLDSQARVMSRQVRDKVGGTRSRKRARQDSMLAAALAAPGASQRVSSQRRKKLPRRAE